MAGGSGAEGRNEVYKCIVAAPRRMRMASRGEMFRNRERIDRCIVKGGGEGEVRGSGRGGSSFDTFSQTHITDCFTLKQYGK